jgi:RIO kinase 1
MPNDPRSIDLSRGNYVRGQLRGLELRSVLTLYGEHDVPPEVRFAPHDLGHHRLITDITGVIGDGKEATVYRCRADPRLHHDHVAVKVYRIGKFRAFANAAVYRAGEHVRDRRARRAMERGTRAGRTLGHHAWIDREWEHMCTLFEAGAHIPEPLACSPDSIAMEYFGDAEQAAPRLVHVRLQGTEARHALDAILYNVELMLSCDRIHGDLSAYNILYDDDHPVLIDLPQMVIASHNPNARALLERDVDNVCAHFERLGVRTRPRAFTASLWRRFQRAEL